VATDNAALPSTRKEQVKAAMSNYDGFHSPFGSDEARPAPRERERGQCLVCWTSQYIRKDGKLVRHDRPSSGVSRLSKPGEKEQCRGSYTARWTLRIY
jgi:hypothetical protein